GGTIQRITRNNHCRKGRSAPKDSVFSGYASCWVRNAHRAILRIMLPKWSRRRQNSCIISRCRGIRLLETGCTVGSSGGEAGGVGKSPKLNQDTNRGSAHPRRHSRGALIARPFWSL